MVKKINRSRIRQEEIYAGDLSAREREIFSLAASDRASTRSEKSTPPYVVLKYFQSNWQCFSEWEKSELRQFSQFIDKLSATTWQEVYSAKGFGYKAYQVENIPNKSAKSYLNTVRKKISGEITFFELRISREMRLHGFRCQSAFFLVLLDRNHDVFPE